MNTPDITYIPDFLTSEKSTQVFDALKDNIKWSEYVFSENGEKVKLNRKMAYISDKPEKYSYANFHFETEDGTWNNDGFWIKYLVSVKNTLELKLNKKFNSVLLNYYKDGKDEIKWHSDKEQCLGEHPVIACVNLGATRKFWLQEKKENGNRFFHELKNGDLLVMNENCQRNFLHAILKEKEITEPRISLTYRLCNI